MVICANYFHHRPFLVILGLGLPSWPILNNRGTIRDHPVPILAVLVSLGPSWSNLFQPGPSWAILGHPGPSRSIRGHPGPSWAILGRPREKKYLAIQSLSWLSWAIRGIFWPFWTILDVRTHPRPSGQNLALFWPFLSFLSNPGRRWLILAHPGPSYAMMDHPRPFWHIRGNPTPSLGLEERMDRSSVPRYLTTDGV